MASNQIECRIRKSLSHAGERSQYGISVLPIPVSPDEEEPWTRPVQVWVCLVRLSAIQCVAAQQPTADR